MFPLEEQIKGLREFDEGHLLDILAVKAQRKYDGHYTVLRFTHGYKVALGTPDLDSDQGRWQVFALPEYDTLKEALVAAIILEQSVGEGPVCPRCAEAARRVTSDGLAVVEQGA